MKTQFLSLIFIICTLFCFTALAQEETTTEEEGTEEEYFKPDYGMFTVEYNFSPLSENPISLEHIRMRYFIDYDMALRASIILDGEEGGSTPLRKRDRFKWGIEAGMEFHWESTKHLSPYLGFELQYVNETYSQRNTVGTTPAGDPIIETHNGVWLDDMGNIENQGNQRIGLSYIMGTDLYILKNFYLGLELGLNFGYNTYQNYDVGVLGQEGSATNIFEGGEGLNVIIDASNFIRVGYAF